MKQRDEYDINLKHLRNVAKFIPMLPMILIKNKLIQVLYILKKCFEKVNVALVLFGTALSPVWFKNEFEHTLES